MPPRTTRQLLEELATDVQSTREEMRGIRQLPIHNGGFVELQKTVAAIDARQEMMYNMGERRHEETLVWREDMTSRMDDVRDRVTVLETKAGCKSEGGRADALKAFFEKWAPVGLAVVVTVGAWVGVNYAAIVEFIKALL